MRLLLDTQCLLWSAIRPERLRSWEADLLKSISNEVLVSSVSLFEIGIKVRLGKLPEAAHFDRDIISNVTALGFTLLAISPEVMVRAAHFASDHRDPFDRIIAAQAIHLDVPVLTTDAQLEVLGAQRLTAPKSI